MLAHSFIFRYDQLNLLRTLSLQVCLSYIYSIAHVEYHTVLGES